MQTHDRMVLTVMTRRFFPSFVLSTEPFPPRLCLGKSRPEYRGSFYLSLCVLFILRRLEGRKPRPPALEKNKKNSGFAQGLQGLLKLRKKVVGLFCCFERDQFMERRQMPQTNQTDSGMRAAESNVGKINVISGKKQLSKP